MRIHKSHIIFFGQNWHHPEKDFVIIEDEKLPIGITYRRELLEQLEKQDFLLTINCSFPDW